MAIVVRFVDKSGFVRERFLDLVHVKDTTSLTLKTEICAILSHHNLNVQNIRGQGYDGASNMRGEWNGLQALFLIQKIFWEMKKSIYSVNYNIMGKADMYPLVDRLLRLVLTLPASTTTSERAFSAMKIVKTSLRNRMEDEFLRDYLIVYIEKEIAETISTEEIIDSFYLIKERRAHLK
ncbi:zinc finger MYM-type protein 1-like [Heracleum sosnowskyi]|uniref:Zinc finger MYM-type protein 1-like n=1 Tax=Heracleum sosnowskyi TaxID=360622 RepID=A0AAD8HSL6_9APIA|nr:zinc finger MYM-type protein 1-like [Heracleum sosnowskyi]